MAETKAKAATKSAVFQALAEKTGRSRKEIAAVFDALTDYIKSQIGKKGPGIFTVPGLLKIKRVVKPETKEREGKNPRTGEPMIIKAKPKRTVVKPLALKGLKEMVK